MRGNRVMCDAPRLPLSNNETLFADLSFCFSPCRVSVCVCDECVCTLFLLLLHFHCLLFTLALWHCHIFSLASVIYELKRLVPCRTFQINWLNFMTLHHASSTDNSNNSDNNNDNLWALSSGFWATTLPIKHWAQLLAMSLSPLLAAPPSVPSAISIYISNWRRRRRRRRRRRCLFAYNCHVIWQVLFLFYRLPACLIWWWLLLLLLLCIRNS